MRASTRHLDGRRHSACPQPKIVWPEIDEVPSRQRTGIQVRFSRLDPRRPAAVAMPVDQVGYIANVLLPGKDGLHQFWERDLPFAHNNEVGTAFDPAVRKGRRMIA